MQSSSIHSTIIEKMVWFINPKHGRVYWILIYIPSLRINKSVFITSITMPKLLSIPITPAKVRKAPIQTNHARHESSDTVHILSQKENWDLWEGPLPSITKHDFCTYNNIIRFVFVYVVTKIVMMFLTWLFLTWFLMTLLYQIYCIRYEISERFNCNY